MLTIGDSPLSMKQHPFSVLAVLLLLLGQVMALLGAWLVTLGAAGPLGIFTRLENTLSTTNIGGAVNTASGLTFIAAAQDDFLRAFDNFCGARPLG